MSNRPLSLPARTLSRRPTGAHAGLWHEKFFDAYDDKWQCKSKESGTWLQQQYPVDFTAGDKTQIKEFLMRQSALRKSVDGKHRDFRTTWHFASGLGNPHAIGNGFVWHPTLAAPYLPASGVKGLLKGWLAWQGMDEDHWLGTPECAGALIFFDALPVVPVAVGADVMTPHMGKWYQEGGEAQPGDWARLPADWHEPKPVPFLVVKDGCFRFMVAPTPRARAGDVTDALAQLEQALKFLGAGAKTAAGYGRMEPA